MAIVHRSFATGLISGSSVSINKPSGAEEKDILVLIISWNHGTASAASSSGPAGWVKQGEDNNTVNGKVTSFYTKILGTGEPASYTFTLTSSGTNAGVYSVSAFSGAKDVEPGSVGSASDYGVTDSSWPSPSIGTSPVSGCEYVGGHTATNGVTISSPGGYTSRGSIANHPNSALIYHKTISGTSAGGENGSYSSGANGYGYALGLMPLEIERWGVVHI